MMRKNNRKIQYERDHNIVQFIDNFQAATTDTIHELFFIKEDGTHTTLRMAQDTLKRLEEYKEIKRDRRHVSEQYYCYPVGRKPTSQLKHTLLITDFYRELHRLKGVKIYEFARVTTGDFRPDSIVAFTINDSDLIIIFLEVEISNKKFDIEKYAKYRRKKEYETIGVDEMPTLVVVTNKRKLPDAHGINVIKIKTDLSDIDQILKLKGAN